MPKISAVYWELNRLHFTNGGMEVNELKRFKELEEENNRLKRMYANLTLVHEALKDAVAKSCSA